MANNVSKNNGEVVKSQYNVKMLSLQQADNAIDAIIKGGKALRVLAHETAVGIMLHYAEHGDYTRLQKQSGDKNPRLLEAIQFAFSKSMGVAFIDWVQASSSLRWSEENKKFYHNKRDKRIPEGKPGFFDMSAIEVPFFEMEREPALPKPQDFNALLVKLIKQGERLIEQAKEGVERDGKRRKIAHKVDEKLLADLEAFAKVHGIEIEREEAA